MNDIENKLTSTIARLRELLPRTKPDMWESYLSLREIDEIFAALPALLDAIDATPAPAPAGRVVTGEMVDQFMRVFCGHRGSLQLYVHELSAAVRAGLEAALAAAGQGDAVDNCGRPWRDAFKNFHRSLCARFGYVHDEKGWQRDQVSLEEHIAAEIAALRSELFDERERHRIALVQRDDYRKQLDAERADRLDSQHRHSLCIATREGVTRENAVLIAERDAAIAAVGEAVELLRDAAANRHRYKHDPRPDFHDRVQMLIEAWLARNPAEQQRGDAAPSTDLESRSCEWCGLISPEHKSDCPAVNAEPVDLP